MGRSVPIYQADAFSAVPFAGNPAAVCIIGAGETLSDDLCLKIAAENNLS